MSIKEQLNTVTNILAVSTIAAIGLAFGATSPTTTINIIGIIVGSIGINLGSSDIQQLKEKFFSDIHNHDLQNASSSASIKALHDMENIYLKQIGGAEFHLREEQKSVKSFFDDLDRHIKNVLSLEDATNSINEQDFKDYICLTPEKIIEKIRAYIPNLTAYQNRFIEFFIEHFDDYFSKKMQFYFFEELKTDTKAWRVFQRLMFESLNANVNVLQTNQDLLLKKLDDIREQLENLKDNDTRSTEEPFQKGLENILNTMREVLKEVVETKEIVIRTEDRTVRIEEIAIDIRDILTKRSYKEKVDIGTLSAKFQENQKLVYFDLIEMVLKKSFRQNEINELRGLAIGKDDQIYVSDIGNNRIHVFSFNFKYKTSFGNKGLEPGNFNGPRGIAIDNDNNIYVVDRDNSRIQKFDYKGLFICQFGSENIKSLLVMPWGICIDEFGDIYVSSAGSNQIKKFDKNGQLIKYWGELGKGEGQFKNPLGIAIDKFQNIYVADNLNNRIQKFDKEGNYLLKWWTAYGDENGPINNPYAITIFDDIVYVAESINFRIRLFDLNGIYLGKLQTNPKNTIYSCKGIIVDKKGDVYMSNTEMHHIIKLRCKDKDIGLNKDLENCT